MLAIGVTIQELAALLQADVKTSCDLQQLAKLAPLDEAGAEDLSFVALDHNKIQAQSFWANLKVGTVLISKQDAKYCPEHINQLVVTDTRVALASLLKWLQAKHALTSSELPANQIAASVQLGENLSLGRGLILASGVKLGAGVVLGDNCQLAENVILEPNVVLHANTIIGANTVIKANSVLGGQGFGFAMSAEGKWLPLIHLGGVLVGSNVHIGSNTCIDRGLIGNTIIEDNVIIDNLVQIAHNVHIGQGSAIAGCTAVAGSAKIGRYCLIGGGCRIGGHLKIADKVVISGASNVANNIDQAEVYSSAWLAQPKAKWWRMVAHLSALARNKSKKK